MRVQNIECQLAQGQINRYLAGDRLSETALSQLEAHVDECPDCKLHLEEKRKTLQAILGGSAPTPPAEAPAATHAVVEMPTAGPRNFINLLANRVNKSDESPAPKPQRIKKEAIRADTVIEDRREPAPATNVYVKPLIYSAGLALVLIAMSTIMKDPTRILGERAAATNAPISQPSGASNPANAASATVAPAAGRSEAELQAFALFAANAMADAAANSASDGTSMAQALRTAAQATPVQSAANLGTRTARPSARPTASNRQRVGGQIAATRRAPMRRSKPAPKTGSGIRIYDSQGRPLN
jgi:hypothetical protein